MEKKYRLKDIFKNPILPELIFRFDIIDTNSPVVSFCRIWKTDSKIHKVTKCLEQLKQFLGKKKCWKTFSI